MVLCDPTRPSDYLVVKSAPSIDNARAACCGTTPLPNILSSALRDNPNPVTQPSGSPIIHSTNAGASPLSLVGVGAARPMVSSHRLMAAS